MTLELGATAPPFSLPGVDGRRHALGDYSDSSALVLIQACNQCPYVQSWQGRIIDLQREFGERGVAIVAFNSNDESSSPGESFEEMKDRAEAESFNFDYLHDEEQSLAKALGAERTPEVFVFDGQRRLVYHGAVDDSRDDTAVRASFLRDALNATLEGRPPPVAESEAEGCSIKWRA